MLGKIVGLQLIHVADLASRIVLGHHRRGDGHEQGGSFGNGGTRRSCRAFRDRLEIAKDLDCCRLLELAALDGFLGKSEGEGHVVAVLRGGEIVDRCGYRRFAFDRLTGSAATGEKGQRSEKGKEKTENGRRHS